ncbi:adult-specific rigid cuticular protein 15.7 [Trichonephila clavipes]|nr:adult-specific rigid cuticular protein 15.7 [Trichonephila clavipes]
MNLTWRNSPAHHWYAAKIPGLYLQCRSSSALQTALEYFKSSYLRGMTFVQGVKSFFTCSCSLSLPASLAHLPDCWSISLRQLFGDQDLVTILFAALAAVHAGALLGHGALVNTGVSTSARSQDAFGNYAFGYDIKDGLGAANSRSEVGDAHGNKKGSYTIADIDGRARRVDYVADGYGFRATVKTNEPGTAASAPAAALIASPYAGPVAPVVNHVAPAAAVVGHAASYSAPLAVAAPVAPIAVAAPLAAPVAVAAPVAYGGVVAHRAAPVAYGGVIGHGATLGLAAPAALPYGASLGLGHGAYLGNGYGLGVAKSLIH